MFSGVDFSNGGNEDEGIKRESAPESRRDCFYEESPWENSFCRNKGRAGGLAWGGKWRGGAPVAAGSGKINWKVRLNRLSFCPHRVARAPDLGPFQRSGTKRRFGMDFLGRRFGMERRGVRAERAPKRRLDHALEPHLRGKLGKPRKGAAIGFSLPPKETRGKESF